MKKTYTFTLIKDGLLRQGNLSILVQGGKAEIDEDNAALVALAESGGGKPEKPPAKKKARKAKAK